MQEMMLNAEVPAISPEALEIANCYITTLSIEETARELEIPKEQVSFYVNKREVKNYVDSIFLDKGYMNRYKLQGLLDTVIEKKLEEMEESELYSSKDIADLIHLAHKMRMEEIKSAKENDKSQINIQQNNFGGDNYNDLLSRIIQGS